MRIPNRFSVSRMTEKVTYGIEREMQETGFAMANTGA